MVDFPLLDKSNVIMNELFHALRSIDRNIVALLLSVVPGAGHLLNVEAPDAVNQLIRHHLETVEASE